MVIAKIIPRKYGTGSFKDSVNYNLGLSRNDTDKVEYVNTINIFAPEVAIAEMESLAAENTRSADPVFNCVLSWRENEIPTKEHTDEAVDIALKELGLDGCQTHYSLHRNTENLHLHICVNRIDPETYKARDPAHGWTKKALEKAARKIELAQGWEVEQSGRYAVLPDGEIVEKSREDKRLKISQSARDFEAHTGEKSAERIGQETAAPIIRSAQTWGELHQKLAECGIAFERKGSGAVLRIGETVIKASQAGRDTSLSKLEKRLGEYRERDAFIALHTSQSETVERVEAVPKVKLSWQDYQKAKAEYLKAKQGAFSDMRKQQAEDCKTMFDNQREDRSALFTVSWKGRGSELNQRRSVMAAKQKQEKLVLSDRHGEERKNLSKRFPRRFPSFKKWLSQDADLEIFAMYRYPGQLVLFAADGRSDDSAPVKNFDIRDYSASVGERRNGVLYRRNDRNTADFIDYGKRIIVSEKFDEASVLAALQLASQKWGAVNISGSEEYKALCVRLAAKHNIKLANPELQLEMNTPLQDETAGIKPEVGQLVAFHPYNSSSKPLDGIVTAIDEDKGKVTMHCGERLLQLNAAKGYFTAADPLEHNQTKEFAYEQAKKYAGQDGLVVYAADDRIYRGPIVAVTPTFAIQKTGSNTVTLHRLVDLERLDEKLISEKCEVAIQKTGKGVRSISVIRQHDKRVKDTGWTR